MEEFSIDTKLQFFDFLTVILRRKFSNKDRDIAASVLRKFEDHSVLYNDLDWEYAGKCVASIERLRQWLNKKVTEELPAKSRIANLLSRPQTACRDFITTVDRLNGEIEKSYKSAKEKRADGIKLCGDEKRLIALVEYRDTPNLLRSEKTNLSEIEPLSTQWEIRQSADGAPARGWIRRFSTWSYRGYEKRFRCSTENHP